MTNSKPVYVLEKRGFQFAKRVYEVGYYLYFGI